MPPDINNFVRLSKALNIDRFKILAESDTSVSTAFTVVSKVSTALRQFPVFLKRHFLLGVTKDFSAPNTTIPNHFIKDKENTKNRVVILTCCY